MACFNLDIYLCYLMCSTSLKIMVALKSIQEKWLTIKGRKKIKVEAENQQFLKRRKNFLSFEEEITISTFLGDLFASWGVDSHQQVTLYKCDT